jgi:hypothetical protein
MARSISDTSRNGRGHNSGDILSAEDAAALHAYHTYHLRKEMAASEEAKAVYDAKRKDVNARFSLIKGELRIARKDMEELLALQSMSDAELVAHEAARTARMVNHGLPVGAQMELDLSGDTVSDQNRAYTQGFTAGRRGEPGTPPDTVATFLHPNWQEGWGDGQAALIGKMARAEEIRARDTASDKPDSDRGDEEEAEVDDIARDLAAGGFLERAGDDELSPKASEVFPGDEKAAAIDRKAAKKAERQAALAH